MEQLQHLLAQLRDLPGLSALAAAWRDLPEIQRDVATAVAYLLPLVLIGLFVRRGFAPGPLVRGLLRRYRVANLLFVLLISVSIAMGLALTAQEHGLRKGIARAAEKFELVITAPGSELNMMLASVYLRAADVPLLDGATYNAVAEHGRVTLAAPLAFGDSVGDAPVVGTTAEFVVHLSDGQVEGRLWDDPFEAVAGAFVPVALGQSVTPAHGIGDSADPDAHDFDLTIVGRMAPTGSPWDNAILVPVESVWQVHGLADGHAPENAGQLGPPFDADYFPGTPAILVKSESLPSAYALRSEFTRALETMAFFPGAVLSNLYRVMGDIRQAMSLMATVSQVLVALSVLLGLFILTQLFQRQLALLRAIGAPRRFVVAVVWSYAVTLLLAGAVLGVGLGYGATVVLSGIVTAQTGILVRAELTFAELHMVLAFLSATSILSLLTARAVMRRPVAQSLRA